MKNNREANVDAILEPYFELIKSTPALTSALYDADFLPEQCVTEIGARHLALLCEVWKKAFPIEGAKPALGWLIDQWADIVKLHNDDLSKPVEQTTLAQFSKADRLKAKAQMVLAALVHYQIELER